MSQRDGSVASTDAPASSRSDVVAAGPGDAAPVTDGPLRREAGGVDAVGFDAGPQPEPDAGGFGEDARAPVLAACSDDRYEENDFVTQASPITSGDHRLLQVCTDDDDWFVFQANEDDEIELSSAPAILHFVDFVRLHLFDADASLVGTAWGSSLLVPELARRAPRTGDYFVRVRRDTGQAESVVYTLSVLVAPCADDPWEPDDERSEARELVHGRSHRVCRSDPDYLSFTWAPGTDGLRFDAASADGEGDLRLEVSTAAGTVVASDLGSAGLATLAFAPSGTGMVLRVSLPEDEGTTRGNSYTVTQSVVPGCAPDRLEPNDDVASARARSPGSHPNLSACREDFDYYSVNVGAGVSTTARVVYDVSEGRLTLRLLAPDGATISNGSGGGSGQSTTREVTTSTVAGTRILRVGLSRDTGRDVGSAYQLEIE